MAKKIDYASMFTLRSDGRYQGYWHELDAQGQPKGKRHTICHRDPKTLYDLIQKKEAPGPLTFSDIAQKWHDAKWDKMRSGTQVCYAPAYKRAIERFGDRIAAEIESFEIANHLEWLKSQNYSGTTIRAQRVIYNSVFRYAIIDPVMGREIRINPVSNVPIPSGIKKPTQRTAPEDDIVQKIRTEGLNARFGLFALFVMSTGLRRGEALAIQWRDIDFKAKKISVTKKLSYEGKKPAIEETKTSHGIREVPILPDLIFALSAAKPNNASPTDYVFHGEDASKFMPEITYRRYWLRYCKDMGFVTDDPETRISKQGKRYIVHHYKNTLTAHVLRHGYATMLFEADIDEYTAKTLMGHSKIQTTRAIYTHLRNKKKTESLEKLEKYVANEMKTSAVGK